MKKLLFTFIMLIPIVAWAQTKSGTTGDCTWKYDSSSKMLRISGSGAMGNYTLTHIERVSQRHFIKNIKIYGKEGSLAPTSQPY